MTDVFAVINLISIDTISSFNLSRLLILSDPSSAFIASGIHF